MRSKNFATLRRIDEKYFSENTEVNT